jgi:hypothetical protein
LIFSKKNLPQRSFHNQALYLDFCIHKYKIKRDLIDGGVGLNIFTFKLLKQLGYSNDVIEKNKSITIRAYDDMKRIFEGTIKLPIQVGPTIAKMTC